MANIATTVIQFSEQTPADADALAGGIVFEADGETTPGSVIKLRCWANDAEKIKNLILKDGDFNNFAASELKTNSSVFSENVSFSGSNSAQMSFPMIPAPVNENFDNSISGQVAPILSAVSAIIEIADNSPGVVVATAGSVLRAPFAFLATGAAGVESTTKKYYGTVRAAYVRGPHYLEWLWVVPDQTKQFFFYVCDPAAGIKNVFEFSITASEIVAAEELQDRAFEQIGETTPGSVIEMIAWAADIARLENLRLRDGSFGTLQAAESKLSDSADYEVTEIVTFSNSNTTQLGYPTKNLKLAIAYTGIIDASNENNPLLIRSRGAGVWGLFSLVSGMMLGVADTAKKFYGGVKVTYDKGPYMTRWTWTVPSEPGDYNFYVTEGRKIVYVFTITVDGDATGTIDRSPRSVSIKITDHVTGAPLSGAAVEIVSIGTGFTDAEGIATWEGVPVGVYEVKTSATGYIPSADDDLDNDYVVVE